MMIIALSAVVAAFCALLVCRLIIPDRYRPTRTLWLLGVAGGMQLALLTSIPPAPTVLISVVCALGWMACNASVPGMPVLMAGAGMNGLAMALHGGMMPLAPSLAERWQVGAAGTLVPGTKTVVGTAGTLHWLSDAIPFVTPWGRYAASVGDMVMLLALIIWVGALLLHTPRIHQSALFMRNIQ